MRKAERFVQSRRHPQRLTRSEAEAALGERRQEVAVQRDKALADSRGRLVEPRVATRTRCERREVSLAAS